MERTIEGRAGGAALALALLLVGLPVAGQAPVAIGEPKAGVELSGVVQMEGVAVPGVEVSARRVEGGEERATATDASGRFRLPNLSPGTWAVTARLQGFATISRQVTLSPGSASSVTLAFGGPVAVAEPKAPTPTPIPAASPTASPTPGPAVAVVERSETSDVRLQTWLSEEAAAGRRLERVVPLRGGASLFVFRASDREAKPPIVLLVASAPTAASLEARLKAHAQRSLLGLHLLPGSSYLLVLSDGE